MPMTQENQLPVRKRRREDGQSVLPGLGSTAGKERGNSFVEVALMMPWILFLFVGVFDFGFYAYSFISVQNAARVGAMRASAGAFSSAYLYAIGELQTMPNAPSAGTCAPSADNSSVTVCGSVTITAEPVPAGADGEPAASVSVTYRMLPLIPIPGLLSGPSSITRTVQMRIRPS